MGPSLAQLDKVKWILLSYDAIWGFWFTDTWLWQILSHVAKPISTEIFVVDTLNYPKLSRNSYELESYIVQIMNLTTLNIFASALLIAVLVVMILCGHSVVLLTYFSSSSSGATTQQETWSALTPLSPSLPPPPLYPVMLSHRASADGPAPSATLPPLPQRSTHRCTY